MIIDCHGHYATAPAALQAFREDMPDDGLLTERIPWIAPTPALRQAPPVDNPTRLYWGDGA